MIKFKMNKYLLLALIIILILIGLFLLFSRNLISKKPVVVFVKPTPTTSTQNLNLDLREQRYPLITLQPTLIQNKNTGSLIVTSDQSGIKIVIDPPQKDVFSENDQIISVNSVPFKIMAFPIGDHTLIATKPGYKYATINFTIKSDETTRLDIFLIPIGDEEWIARLPLKNTDYYVEYLPKEDKIIATIYTFPSFSIPKEGQIKSLQDEIKNKLTEIGVDINKTQVQWIIK